MHTLDAVELLNKQAVRLCEGNKIGCCPSVRMVKFLGRANPDLGCIDLGEPSDEACSEKIEGRDA